MDGADLPSGAVDTARADPPVALADDETWFQPVTRRVFGIVPEMAVRRHPSELWRIAAAALLVALWLIGTTMQEIHSTGEALLWPDDAVCRHEPLSVTHSW